MQTLKKLLTIAKTGYSSSLSDCPSNPVKYWILHQSSLLRKPWLIRYISELDIQCHINLFNNILKRVLRVGIGNFRKVIMILQIEIGVEMKVLDRPVKGNGFPKGLLTKPSPSMNVSTIAFQAISTPSITNCMT